IQCEIPRGSMRPLKHNRNIFLGDTSGIAKDRPSQSRPSTFGEAWPHSLLENTSDVIAVLEVDGTIRYASPAVERMLGYSPEEVIGTSVFYYVHPDDYERALEAFAETLERPRVLPTLEFRARRSERVMNLGGNRIGMRILRLARSSAVLRFP